MKSLKLEHELAQAVVAGTKTNTWRINDDKNLSVNDELELIDKVDPAMPESWRSIGRAKITQITEKRLGDIADTEIDGHELYESREAMYETFKRYYGPDIGDDTPVKIVGFSFAPYKKPKDLSEQPVVVEQVKLFGDGGSRGNPGHSAAGYVLLDMQDNVIKKSGVYLGITTNNQAEYQSLKLGLEEASKLGAREVVVYMDSMLVINQMKGVFKVKNRDLWPIYEAIKEQVKLFKKVTFTHVPRELNKLADAEVNSTLDAELGISRNPS